MKEAKKLHKEAGSGWVLQENHSLALEMVDHQPIGGNSYIELPKDVYDIKAVINVKNDDQKKFHVFFIK